MICNPASSGGGYDPTESRREIEGYELEWITTRCPGDAREAAKEWHDGLLVVVGGDGTTSEVVNGLEPAVFTAIPQALRVVVGPGHVPEPYGSFQIE